MNDYTPSFDPQDIKENSGISVLAYLGFLFFIPLVVKPQSPYVRFHANQGLILFLAEIAGGIVLAILSAILIAIWWRLAVLVSIISTVYWLAIGVMAILGIINAVGGKAKELPFIGKITLIK